MSRYHDMQFEWDEAKNLGKIRNYRMDFADVPKDHELNNIRNSTCRGEAFGS